MKKARKSLLLFGFFSFYCFLYAIRNFEIVPCYAFLYNCRHFPTSLKLLLNILKKQRWTIKVIGR